jgi:hypothetical protein
MLKPPPLYYGIQHVWNRLVPFGVRKAPTLPMRFVRVEVMNCFEKSTSEMRHSNVIQVATNAKDMQSAREFLNKNLEISTHPSLDLLRHAQTLQFCVQFQPCNILMNKPYQLIVFTISTLQSPPHTGIDRVLCTLLVLFCCHWLWWFVGLCSLCLIKAWFVW